MSVLFWIFLGGLFALGLAISPLLTALHIRLASPEKAKAVAAGAIARGWRAIYKPTITFDGSSELNLKKRSYDEEHDREYLSFGGLLNSYRRTIFDPGRRTHDFYGTPFSIVDERFGIAIDPRDVTTGHRLEQHQQHGDYVHETTQGNTLSHRVLGVFALPKGTINVPDLSHVWTLVGGSASAQVIDTITELYKTSQDPKTKNAGMKQILIPLGAFLAVLLIGVFASGQDGGAAAAAAGSGTTGGGGGGNRTIGVGTGLLTLLASTTTPTRSRRDTALYILAGLAYLGLGGLLATALPTPFPLLGITLPFGLWGLVLFTVGILVPPVVASWFGRSLGPIGSLLGELYLTLGFYLGYSRPIIHLTEDEEYVVEEYDPDTHGNPTWYRFALTRIGLSHANTTDAWPGLDTTIHHEELETLAEHGDPNQAPYGYVATDDITSAGYHAFIPNEDRISEDEVFVQTKHTTGTFHEAGQDRALLLSALEHVKKKYGGGHKPMSDRTMWIATVGGVVVALAIDFMVFL